MVTTINGKRATWDRAILDKWLDNVRPLFVEGESCPRANYFTPRRYRNEYDRGSKTEGFVYVVNPGQRVCVWERTVK